MSTARPVVGIGAVASVGGTAEKIFAALCAGRSGLGPLRGFRREWYSAAGLFEIGDRTACQDVPGRATAFLLDAVGQALADAGLDDLTDVPVLVGTGMRELRSAELWDRGAAPAPVDRLHFGTALRERFGAARTYTVSNACSASLYALALGTDLLDAGEADTVVVAGTDAITESMFGVADRLQSVPPDTLRPFDRNRAGTVLGEGAACVVLRRSAGSGDQVHGVVRGVAVNCDALHPTAPDADSIREAIGQAHDRAGVVPADVDLVMLHGTGTHANDDAEAAAVGAFFGSGEAKPLMTAIKSMTGHTSGASGLHSLITALQAIGSGRVPPTVSLDDPIDGVAAFRIVRSEAEPAELDVAQVNAFGFGGINAVAIVAGAR